MHSFCYATGNSWIHQLCNQETCHVVVAIETRDLFKNGSERARSEAVPATFAGFDLVGLGNFPPAEVVAMAGRYRGKGRARSLTRAVKVLTLSQGGFAYVLLL